MLKLEETSSLTIIINRRPFSTNTVLNRTIAPLTIITHSNAFENLNVDGALQLKFVLVDLKKDQNQFSHAPEEKPSFSNFHPFISKDGIPTQLSQQSEYLWQLMNEEEDS